MLIVQLTFVCSKRRYLILFLWFRLKLSDLPSALMHILTFYMVINICIILLKYQMHTVFFWYIYLSKLLHENSLYMEQPIFSCLCKSLTWYMQMKVSELPCDRYVFIMGLRNSAFLQVLLYVSLTCQDIKLEINCLQ